MSERKHHVFSPSQLQSLEACPCYVGKQSTHERTIAGTIAHSVTESGLDDNRLSDDDAEAAAECLDFVERRRQRMEEARMRAISSLVPGLQAALRSRSENSEQDEALIDKRFPKLIELKEAYLPVDDLVFDDDYCDPLTGKQIKQCVVSTTAGYVDHAIISHCRTYAEMIDFKFGFWPVESADNNLQGIAYALGLFKQYPTIKTIKFWFKQPHIDSISSTEFLREDVAELYLRVQTVVARARVARHAGDFNTARPFVPGCNFCALIGVCPKVAEFACHTGAKFYPLEIPENITPTMLHTARDTNLGMKLSSVLAVWAKAYRTQTTDRVLRGDADLPTGFSIESKSSRDVADATKFKETALRFISQAEYDNIVDVPGFGKLEEVVKDKAPRGQKKSAIQDLTKSLEDSGAVVRKPAYVFLKAVAETKQQTDQT